jgi:hypothetical protein
VSFTQEGESVGIVLIPHRDLAGLSLVVWMDPRSADISWAVVSSLHYHDQIDQGKSVERIARSDPEWEVTLRSHLKTEFQRNIQVSQRRTFLRGAALWCTIEVAGRPIEFNVTRLPEAKGLDQSRVVSRGETSLRGPSAPDVSCPVPLAAWHKDAVAAWPTE